MLMFWCFIWLVTITNNLSNSHVLPWYNRQELEQPFCGTHEEGFFNWSSIEPRTVQHFGQIHFKFLVAYDDALYRRFNYSHDRIVRLVSQLLNSVHLVFNRPNMRRLVNITTHLMAVVPALNNPYLDNRRDMNPVYNSFCRWVHHYYDNIEKFPKLKIDYNFATLLSGYNHWSHGYSTSIQGLATVGRQYDSVCGPTACQLVELKTLKAGWVWPHEIGHNLGMNHDGVHTRCENDDSIMASNTGPGKINWSQCSLAAFTSVILNRLNGAAWCFRIPPTQTPIVTFDSPSDRLVNQLTLNEQCRLSLGDKFRVFDRSMINVHCDMLWCSYGFMTIPLHPTLEGAQCSINDQYACQAGVCLQRRNFN